MSNSYFQFRQFTVHQEFSAMKVTTDGCLFGAWAARYIVNDQPNAHHVLDIGTGTGLLSLMIAQQHSARIDGLEIDTAAAAQAASNAALSPWAERINIREQDACRFNSPTLYDVIISNPPFYENELKSPNMLRNLAHHNGGLLLNDLLAIISRQLSPTGRFYLLWPYKRYREIQLLMSDHDLAAVQEVLVKQTPKHEPFRVLLSGGFTRSVTPGATQELIIKEGDKYSAAFTDLLKDYYLYL